MTVETDLDRAQYATNATTGPFTVPFYFLADSDLSVTYTSAGVDTLLTLDVDYTVDGSGDETGGTITTTQAYATGGQLVILRDVSIVQPVEYQEGDGFPAKTHERALDRLTMIAQQLREMFGRAITFPASFSGSTDVGDVTTRAGKLLGFDTITGAITWITAASGSALDLAAQLVGGGGGLLVGFLQAGVGAVLRTIQDELRVKVNIEQFGATAQAGVDNTTAINEAIVVCLARGATLHVPSRPVPFEHASSLQYNYDAANINSLSIAGETGILYYLTNRGSMLKYTGSSGYAIMVNGRGADVGGTNEGSPMPFEMRGISYIGSAAADGCIKFSRAWWTRVKNNNFFGFSKAGGGVITYSADGVTGSSPIAFAGTSTIEGNTFHSSGRCILLTGATGGVVNSINARRNKALDQQYFLAADFGANTPYSENITCDTNHTEGTVITDYYSQGAASNWVIDKPYIEQNIGGSDSPRVDIQGSANYGITVERGTFSKSLGSAGEALVRITNAVTVSVKKNISNYGGSTDRFSVQLLSCTNAEAEVMSTAASATYYPVSMNGAVIASGTITDAWRMVPAGGSGGFVGVSTGDGFPGGSVCTVVPEVNKTNGRVWMNFKATVTTKSTLGTQLLIGVLPYANYGVDVVFPVYGTSLTGTKPFYGVLPSGLTVATVFDATGAPVNGQTALAVGSVVEANFSYLTQA